MKVIKLLNYPKSVQLLSKSLDLSWKRNELIANNIANSDTPGYKRQDISFDAELKKAMSRNVTDLLVTHEGHLQKGKQSVNQGSFAEFQRNTSVRVDGSNVDIDKEMSELAKNQIFYNGLIQQLSKQLGYIKSAVTEGRK